MTVSKVEEKLKFSSIKEDQNSLSSIESRINKGGLWKKIAKNEIRIRTSKVRKHRLLFFASIYAILLIWAFILAPMLFDQFMPIIAEAEQFSEIFVPMVALLIESFMMMFFLIFLIYPLNVVYRKTEIGFKETILASPASASDIFLGEFLGKMPLYSAAVLIFTPIIIGLVNPLIKLTLEQYFAIYGCVFGMVFFANLLGCVLASWIEHKVSQNEKARDLGKALIMVLSILMVVIMYSVQFFLKELMENPELRNWLSFYPSLWFSNIILHVLDPALLDDYFLTVEISLLLAVCVPLLVLYISYKKADAFFTLEGGIEKFSSIIDHEHVFYKFTRYISGRKWGGLITTQFKGFLRKKENLARIAYAIGVIGFMGWFITRDIEDYMDSTVMLSIIIVMGGMIFSIMLGHLIFIDSKDLLWVYKRSPRGINGLVFSYMIMILIFNTIVTMALTILFAIQLELEIVDAVIFFFLFLTYVQISLCQAIGVQCFSPSFETKGGTMQGNVMISMMLQNIPLFIMIFALIELDLSVTPEMMRFLTMSFLILMNTAMSVPVLYFGMKKLNKME